MYTISVPAILKMVCVLKRRVFSTSSLLLVYIRFFVCASIRIHKSIILIVDIYHNVVDDADMCIFKLNPKL